MDQWMVQSKYISIHLGTGQQVPLQAGLSDASVHLIENRREELAQMQWKAPELEYPCISESLLRLWLRVWCVFLILRSQWSQCLFGSVWCTLRQFQVLSRLICQVMRDKMQSFSTDLMQLTKQLAETHQQWLWLQRGTGVASSSFDWKGKCWVWPDGSGGFAVCWCSDSDFACLCLRVWWLSWWCCSFRFLQLFVCMVLSLAVFQGTHFHLAELPTGLKTITLLSFQLCPTFLLIFSLLFWCPIWFLAHQPSVTTFNVALREFYTSWQLKPATQVWDERKWSGCKVGGPKHLGVGAIFSSFQRRSPNLLRFPDLGFPLPDSVFFPFLGFDVFVVFFFFDPIPLIIWKDFLSLPSVSLHICWFAK